MVHYQTALDGQPVPRHDQMHAFAGLELACRTLDHMSAELLGPRPHAGNDLFGFDVKGRLALAQRIAQLDVVEAVTTLGSDIDGFDVIKCRSPPPMRIENGFEHD